MKKKFLIILFLSVVSTGHLNGDFNTLADIKEYASTYPEHPKSDFDDWVDPEYTSFYKQLKPPFLKRIVNKIKRFFWFSVASEWNEKEFEDLLKKVTQKSEKKGDIQKLELNQGDRCMVWGDLHGAFHSLVEDLSGLEREGVITKDLVLTGKNIYFVFIGDLVSRSPYSIEMLHTVLRLIEKNPEQVFFLRGNHETNGLWESFSMRRALKSRLAHRRESVFDEVPLLKEINDFFATLPKSIVISSNKSPEKLWITHSKPEKEIFKDLNVVAALFGEQKIGVVPETKGLKFIGNLAHVARWSLISSPSSIYQRYFNFFYDAFVEFTMNKSIKNSVLTLHHQNTRKREGFSVTHYNPIFGYELKGKKNDFSNKEVVEVGCTASLSGITGPLGTEVVAGMEAAIQNHNSEESKILVKPIIFDDRYVPRKAFKNVQKLYDTYGVDTLLIPIGTPTLSFYINLIFRASYSQEIKALVEYLIKERGIKSFAFFYQDDEYGIPIAEAAGKVLQENGITKWLELPHLRTQQNFSNQVKKIKEFMPDAIGCFSSHFPTVELINQLGTKYFLGKMLFSVSFLYSDAFQTFLSDRGIPFIYSSVVENPYISKLEIAKEHIDSVKHASINTFEGYIAGALFVDAVKNISLPVTKEKIISYFEGMKNYRFKGLELNFDPESRQLFNKIWIHTPENKWIAGD
jgi:ABC-type branched-subunit amino acid transport system substrate-binding protein